MKDQIENAGSVEEMFQALADATTPEGTTGGPVEITVTDAHDAVLVSAAQTFLQLMPRFLQLGEDDQKEFLGALVAYHSPTTDPLTRNTAFYTLYEYLLGKPGEAAQEPKKTEKQIIQCEESDTPCEDCEDKPTHRIKFVLDNRKEEHFLCTKCESAARRE